MIEENVLSVRKKIENAARKTGRAPEDIKLVAITKTVDTGRILEALKAGIRDIGENKVQEALEKYEVIGKNSPAAGGINRHLVGHLQTNKAKKAVEIFDIIQSLDSYHLAEELNKQAQKTNKIQDCLIEIKVSEEPAKTGLSPDELAPFLDKASGLKNLHITGLMAMSPFFDDPEKTRPYFRRARMIFEKTSAGHGDFRYLSMGMSGDFEVAVEEGSNMVRVGTAIFGERNA